MGIRKITTIQAAEREIQALIDSFSDGIFIEALQEMESQAETARVAREEELSANEDDK